MNDLVLMGLIIALMMGAIYLYARKKGGVEKKNLRDWWFIVVVFVVGAFVAGINSAQASEINWEGSTHPTYTQAKPELKWFEYTEFYVGIDYQLRELNPQCVGGGTDDRLTSHGGFTQNVLTYGNLDFEAVYTHHSCAINDDWFVYDAFGIRLNYRIEW